MKYSPVSAHHKSSKGYYIIYHNSTQMKREHFVTNALLDGEGLVKTAGYRAQNFEQVGIIGDFFQKRRIDAGRESGVNSRGCFLRSRIFAAVKSFFEQRGVVFSVFVHDVGVLVGYHLGLRVTGVSLDRLDISAHSEPTRAVLLH